MISFFIFFNSFKFNIDKTTPDSDAAAAGINTKLYFKPNVKCKTAKTLNVAMLYIPITANTIFKILFSIFYNPVN